MNLPELITLLGGATAAAWPPALRVQQKADRGCEADAPGIIGSATVVYAGLAHADRADAGHHLAFRQVPVLPHDSGQ